MSTTAKAQPITVSKKTAAELLDVSVDSINRLIRSGALPAKKQETEGGYGRVFIRVADLDAYIDGLPDA